jgi:magnesium transporter
MKKPFRAISESFDLEQWKGLVGYDLNQAASDFSRLSKEDAAAVVTQVGADYIAGMLERIGSDAASDILRTLPQLLQKKVLAVVSPDRRKLLEEILSYLPGTAGALMAKEFLAVGLGSTIRETTEYLQRIPQDRKGKVSYIYVVDRNQRLEGVIQVRDLVFHPGDKPVREILKGPVVQVETGMSQLAVAQLLQRHRYLGLPVVDKLQRLVGVINADSAMQVLETEASNDIARIVGTSAEEIKTHSVIKILRLRFPWLVVNIVSGLVCALILGFFQHDIREVMVLFLFVPVVLALSESTGVQGATIVVRNLTLGNFQFKNMTPLFYREVLAGMSLGVICGFCVGSIAMLWQGSPKLGLALGVSMILSIFISALLGLGLPMIFKKFKIDPAMASGPLVLAICDVQTLLVYFNLSGFILRV